MALSNPVKCIFEYDVEKELPGQAKIRMHKKYNDTGT